MKKQLMAGQTKSFIQGHIQVDCPGVGEGEMGPIKLPYLVYIFGQIGLNAASYQDLHFLPLTQQFYTYLQVVNCT